MQHAKNPSCFLCLNMANNFEKTMWVAELEVVCELTRKLNAELTLLQIMVMPMLKQPEVT